MPIKSNMWILVNSPFSVKNWKELNLQKILRILPIYVSYGVSIMMA